MKHVYGQEKVEFAPTAMVRGWMLVLVLACWLNLGWTDTPVFNLAQTLSDGAQRTTLAFDGLAMMTGNLEAQSFFPPGKVSDYTGFQYLRDNDPDNMGHNTSFLTRIANNVIYILNDTQLSQLVTLATAQQDQYNLYGYKRFALMKAFRRLLTGDVPTGSLGLNLTAVKQVSHDLYLLDGQIAFDRALLYAQIYSSLDATQKAYLDAMKGKGFNSWPNITDDQISSKMQKLPQGSAVAVMTYASDIYSWYAGSLDADVYFCPERHGTYYGGFYIKDAPAVGHEGYSISEQLTATAGSALCDSAQGYVTAAQAATISSLVDTQRNNLYAGGTNIVQTRTQIATLLRSLLTSTSSSAAVKTQVLALSGTYGDLDGEDNYHYATVFAQVYQSLSTAQLTKLMALRKSIMSGSYDDGTPFDYTICTTPFLYSQPITDTSMLAPYIANTDYLFLIGSTKTVATPTFSPAAGTYNSSTAVTISCVTTGATIHYALGNSISSATAILYTAPFTVSKTTTVKAYATLAGMTDSATATATYVINTFQPDAAVENNGESGFTGVGVFNLTGTGQTKSQSIVSGTPATYIVRVQNTGTTTDAFTLTGTAGSTGWSVQYIDIYSGADITKAMTGAGWTSIALAPNAWLRYTIHITPSATLTAGSALTLTITATSKADATKQDVVKATTTVLVKSQPDLAIKVWSDPTYTGAGVLNQTGVGQSVVQSVVSGGVVHYFFRVLNTGTTADAFKLTSPAVTGGWRVQYVDQSTGTDITTAVTTVGFTTKSLAPNAVATYTLHVWPPASATTTAVCTQWITATSVASATAKDVVGAVTTLMLMNQPDLMLENAGDSAYLGAGIYNTSGTGQTKSAPARPDVAATYYCRVSNAGSTATSFLLTASATDSDWKVRYLSLPAGTDMTSVITGTGWTTLALAPGATADFWIQVTPGPQVAVGKSFTLTITAAAPSDLTKKDVIKAVTTRQ